MASPAELNRRIKRHVIGRTQAFWTVTAPGLEALCARELAALPPPAPVVQSATGGAAFNGRLRHCYLANLHCRTANRVLMRLSAFKTTNFRHLARKLATFPWELYLWRDVRLNVRVATRHCRLYHRGAVAERFTTAIAERLAARGATAASGPPRGSSEQQIFVRGTHDRFDVSLDSSGANLYLRGIKQHGGPAPLRETLAAAALATAGYTGAEVLLDPMCGSGTFALEAALIAKNIPPGWRRAFAFMGWPAFSPRQWDYLKSQHGPKVRRRENICIFASDRDGAACRRLALCVQRAGLEDAVAVFCHDFFDLMPARFSRQPGFVVLNPPYGRRLGDRGRGAALFRSVCDRLQSDYRGWRLVLLAADPAGVAEIPFKLKAQPFFHGGLQLTLLTGVVA
jgi:putative N6-adenine-specific DNA methylase